MDLLRIRKELDSKKASIDKLKGKLEIYQKQLKKLGFKTTKEATKGLDDLTNKAEKLRNKYKAELDKFKAKYGHLL